MAAERPSGVTRSTSGISEAEQPVAMRTGYLSLPNLHVQRPWSLDEGGTAPALTLSPATLTARVGQASFENLDANQLHTANSFGATSQVLPESAVTRCASLPLPKLQETRGPRKHESPPLRRFAAALTRTTRRVRAAPPQETSFVAVEIPAESTYNPSARRGGRQTNPRTDGDPETRGRPQARRDELMQRIPPDEQLRAAVLPPSPAALFGRVVRAAGNALRSGRSSLALLSQQHSADPEIGTPSSDSLPTSDDSSGLESGGAHEDSSDTYMLRVVFLGLFMFGASMLVAMVFFQSVDTVGPPTYNSGAATSVPTVAAEEDSVGHGEQRPSPAAATVVKLLPPGMPPSMDDVGKNVPLRPIEPGTNSALLA